MRLWPLCQRFFCANHFTVSVNRLKTFDSIVKSQLHFLSPHGFLTGTTQVGEIQGTPGELLEQSSHPCRDGLQSNLPRVNWNPRAVYYEFANVIPMPTVNCIVGLFCQNQPTRYSESTNFYNKMTGAFKIFRFNKLVGYFTCLLFHQEKLKKLTRPSYWPAAGCDPWHGLPAYRQKNILCTFTCRQSSGTPQP